MQMDNQIRGLHPTVIAVQPPKPGQPGSNQSRYGSINMSYIPKVIGPGIILTCLFTYIMAISKHEEEPFPYCTITATASHFPQSVVFRLNMLFISGVTLFFWFVIYSWLNFISKKYQCGKVSAKLFQLAGLGSFFFAMAVATIDTGKMNQNLHTFVALTFFIIWIAAIPLITYKIYQFKVIYRSIVSPLSWNIKLFSVAAMIITCIVNVIKYLFPNALYFDPHIDTIEWFVTFSLAIWLFSFSYDWEVFYICMDGSKIALVDLDFFVKRHEQYANYHKNGNQNPTAVY
ncbi:Frag1/DRAM/Sfk1 family protein (macronuclear) [Tetrahymena thermophila SB210]|uniref:Frag1/DRAM/Sfk1 family protein n=1 Tax=Tetrahymena thermophila (strain SB210) TaxID=312017 RepID=I7ML13_TETTS|nr:Frag1/DRAM/Sfk1 family protein [Tetrahymena thermophila SB210]EAS00856.3 Frag1/DRAM/Sfk1 family protein [Tetrahymena thermophila SB210]|eukprot:XP_001021101.3 Frag1/DRAM/Sfk1 family protein [Tetrahymena thermophila SB210]